MQLLIALFLFISILSAGHPTHHAPTSPPPYCYLNQGCAVASVCECPSTFTYCDIKDDYDGVCKFTSAGIATLIAICTTALGLIIFCLCCICGCCCCFGRRTPDNYHVVNYHPTSPSPVGYDGHGYL